MQFMYYEIEIFYDSLSITFLNPKILDFLLSLYGKQPDLGSEMWKIKLQKIVGNLLEKLRKLYMNGTVI